jgi:hypothetical protein
MCVNDSRRLAGGKVSKGSADLAVFGSPRAAGPTRCEEVRDKVMGCKYRIVAFPALRGHFSFYPSLIYTSSPLGLSCGRHTASGRNVGSLNRHSLKPHRTRYRYFTLEMSGYDRVESEQGKT